MSTDRDGIPNATLLWAGENRVQIGNGEIESVPLSMVIQFDTIEDARLALELGKANFDWAWVRDKSA